MSGEVAARDIDGEVRFKSMSGGLDAGRRLRSTGLRRNTMSGQIAADVALRTGATCTSARCPAT